MKIDFLIHEKYSKPEIQICNYEMNQEMKELRDIIDQTVNQMISVYSEGEVKMLRSNEIYRIYSENQRTIAETEQKSYQVHVTLTEMEQMLPKDIFVRISRSELVNLKKIRKIDTSISRTIQMYLKNGTTTYVSRRNVAQIKKVLGI